MSDCSSDDSEASRQFDHQCYHLDEIDTKGGARPIPKGCQDKEIRKERMLYLTREESKMKLQAASDKNKMRIDQVQYKKYKDVTNKYSAIPFSEWVVKYGKFQPFKFGPDPRWRKEKKYKPCAEDDQGRKTGHGSFYKRAYNDYTMEELLARQGRSVRIRTKDLIPFDRLKREMDGDDSELESDWLDRTGHAKGHIPSLGDKAANRILLNDLKGGWLPAAYAVDPKKRTELQKLSYDMQERKCTAAANIMANKAEGPAQEEAQQVAQEEAQEVANEQAQKASEDAHEEAEEETKEEEYKMEE